MVTGEGDAGLRVVGWILTELVTQVRCRPPGEQTGSGPGSR